MVKFEMMAILVGAYSWACLSLHLMAAVSSPCNYSAQMCGNLGIPYPFGMSNECGLPLYRISCKRNASYGAGELPFLQFAGAASPAELHILEFSSTSNTITVNSTELKAMPTPDGCYGKQDGVAVLDLPAQGPFALSDANMFAVIGCNSTGSCVAPSRTTPPTDQFSIECKNGCYNQFDFAFCNSYACCSSAIPAGSRHLNFSANGIAYKEFPGVCGFSTVLTPSTYHLADPEQFTYFGDGQYGMFISWALQIVNKSDNCSACAHYASCLPDTNVPGYTCNCSGSGFRGDGYTHGIGCADIDECKEGLDDCEPWPIGICTNTLGSYNCRCAEGYTGPGFKSTCVADKSNRGLVLGTVFGSLGGAAFIALLIIIAFLARKTYKQKQEREGNFHRNGGAELRSILFSEDQLKKITQNFSRDRELGKGGYGTVYWGILPNKCKVAIKKAKNMDDEDREEEQMKAFVSEILLLGKTTHENIVRLLGCCVETRVPLLVYEFIENGTLWEHLHPPSRFEQTSLLRGSWARRLQIAVGTARALSHLHKTSPPILHRDIKSMNILIDGFYNPKVADFGASRFLTSGATHLTFDLVVGTRGYLDPEYHRSSQFTTKSDVYSFGVVLLELITAKPPDLGTTLGLLAHHFQSQFRKKTHTQLIDSKLGSDSRVFASIEEVVELAMDCVALEGSQRPTMEQVLQRLIIIQSKAPSLISEDHGMESRYSTDVVISAADSEEFLLADSHPLASTSSSNTAAARELGLISL